MFNQILNALVSGMVGTIAFVVLKAVISGQDTSTWTSAEISMITIIPVVMGILVIVGMFMGLTKIRGTGK